jgi:cytochrome P450 family 619
VWLTHNLRAQEEIDTAVDESRSPTWGDFPKLPYINMMIKESHRWRPVSPLGVSHAVAEGEYDACDAKPPVCYAPVR